MKLSFFIKKYLSRRFKLRVESELKYISAGLMSTVDLSLQQCWKELGLFSEKSEAMFVKVRVFGQQKDDKGIREAFLDLQEKENLSDKVELEIATYIHRISEMRLTAIQVDELQMLMSVLSEIERLNDSSFRLVCVFKQRQKLNIQFNSEMGSNLDLMLNMVEGLIHQMNGFVLINKVSRYEYDRALEIRSEIAQLKNQLKLQNIADIIQNKYLYLEGASYIEVVLECKKMADIVIDVIELLYDGVMKKHYFKN